MKAGILHKPHTPLSIDDVDLDPPAEGEVILAMAGAGVCHSDYHFMDGHMTPWKTPWGMGHEGAGTVIEVGPEVQGLSTGDKVILSLDTMCGRCRNCTNGRPALCENNPRVPVTRMRTGGTPIYHFRPTFAEHTLASADACVKVPDDTPLEKACLISCAIITGVGAVVNRAQVKPGETMVVFGCGGVGLNAVQGGVLAGAGQIIAIDTVDFKLEKAEEFGATHFVNASKEDPVERVKQITGGGADYAFEVVGFPAIVRQAIESVPPTGSAVVVGVQPSGQEVSVEGWHLLQDRSLIVAFHGTARPRVDFPWMLELYKQGRLKIDELISRYRPLDEVNQAFEDMKAGTVARSVLVFD